LPEVARRIALIGNGFSPYVAMTAQQLTACGFTVQLTTLGDANGIPGVSVRTRAIPKGPAAAVSSFISYMRELREFAPHLTYVIYAGGRLGTLALISGNHPLVVNVIGGDVQEEQHFGELGPLDRRATRRLLQEADLILSKSDALRTDIARHGSFEDKVQTVRWGVDVEQFRRDPQAGAAVRRRLNLSDDAPLILSPRSFRRLYQTHLIVEALPRVLNRVPGATLLISEYQEEPSYAAEVRAMVATMGLVERVRFLGAVSHHEMKELLSAASAVVSIPSADGLPQTALEAMAAEAPLVMGRLPAYREIVSEDEAALVDFNPASIADATVRLLTDAVARDRQIAAALARVKKIADLRQETARVGSLLNELMSKPVRRSSLAPRILDLASLPFRLRPPAR
jgi:L-malate glycosyltransferase